MRKKIEFLIRYLLILTIISGCQKTSQNEPYSTNLQEAEKKYKELTGYFGIENLRMDVKQDIIEDRNPDSLFVDESKVKYIKVRITHIPTGRIAFGESYDNQLMNAVEALMILQKEIEK